MALCFHNKDLKDKEGQRKLDFFLNNSAKIPFSLNNFRNLKRKGFTRQHPMNS